MKKVLVCNQKMYLTYDEAKILRKGLSTINTDKIDLIIAPSYLNYEVFKDYTLSAQNVFYEDQGPYTGEVSAYDLSLRGIKYSLVGHSERRIFDTDEIINKKINALFRNSMIPILCIGETKIEKEMHKTSEVLKKQLTKALKDINYDYDMIYIAYEPRFLIGGKNALSKEEIIDIFKYIKKILFNLGIDKYKLLYGGAITSNNINNLNSDMIDGYLLGSSCVDIEELKNIIKCTNV